MRDRERSARTNRSLASLAWSQPFLGKATREGGRPCRVSQSPPRPGVVQSLLQSCFQQPWLTPSLQKPEQLAVTIMEPFQGIHGGFKMADANIVRAVQLAVGLTGLLSEGVRAAIRESPTTANYGIELACAPTS